MASRRRRSHGIGAENERNASGGALGAGKRKMFQTLAYTSSSCNASEALVRHPDVVSEHVLVSDMNLLPFDPIGARTNQRIYGHDIHFDSNILRLGTA
jgi:hypothetical protein